MRSDALRTIFTSDEQFDDLRRARIWARLAPRLPSQAATPRRWPWLVAAGALATAAVLAFVLHQPADGAIHVVPANGVLALPLGPATHAALAGPGELLVVAAGERTVVELHGGTLYGEFAGAPGRSLRIEANGTVIEIVGTLFSVTSNADATCVAVAHGRVKFTARGITTYVGGGQQSCAARGTPPSPTRALDGSMHDALVHFDRAWLATNEPLPSAPAAAPAEPPPAPVAAAVAAVKPSPAAALPARAAVQTEAPIPHAEASIPQAAAPKPPKPDAPNPEPPKSEPLTPEPPKSLAPKLDAPNAQPPPTADALYRAADAALARGDAAAADHAFAELLANDPDSALADEALYERARLAFARGDWTATRGFVAQLATHMSSALREPAFYLGCRAAVSARAGDAEQCFTDYIAAFPDGPHVGDARAQLQRGAR